MKINKHRNVDGFTIVELMVAVAIFSLVAAGIASTSALISRVAVSNIYQNTAYTVAQGYAEQIKSLSYVVIQQALIDPANNDIPTLSLSMGSGAVSELDDPLIFGQRMLKEVVVDVQQTDSGEQRERVMNMWFTTTGQSLLATDGINAIEITLDFEWELNDRSIRRTYLGSVKIVKTAISEF